MNVAVPRWIGRSILPILAVLAVACADPVAVEDDEDEVIDQASIELTEEQRVGYEEDAVNLAIRHLEEIDAPEFNDVYPPSELVTSLFDALVHVHLTEHPVRDTVIDVYQIPSFSGHATRSIMVRVDLEYEWTQAWRQEVALTGYPEVDALMITHDLLVSRFYEWLSGDVAVLRANRPLNTTALAALFEPIPGVMWAERSEGSVGRINDIDARPHDDGWQLDYSVGFGDCPSGCVHRHIWSFSVSEEGTVAFLGRSGPPPPERP